MAQVDERIKATGKVVLLFSGGLDSLTIAKILNPDVLLHAPMGSPFESSERTAVNRLLADGYIHRDQYVDASEVLNLSRFDTRHDRIVPNRNAYLAMLASHFGEHIILGVVAGEARSTDKDQPFCDKVNALLNHIWKQPAKWCEQHEFHVQIPFVNTTKTELVRQYLELGNSPAGLLISYSCYNGGMRHCGHCTACVRKWVALVNNCVYYPWNYFMQSPRTYPELEAHMEQMEQGLWRGPEDAETLQALRTKWN